MTSAYLQQLGRAELSPKSGQAGTAQGNYQDINANLEEGINEQIDQQNQELRNEFRRLGQYYNDLYDKRAKIPEQLLRMTETGFKTSQSINELNEWNKTMSDFEKTIRPGTLEAKLGAETLDNPISDDKEYVEDVALDNPRNANKQARADLAGASNDAEAVRQLLPDNTYDVRERFDNKNARDILRNYPIFMDEAGQLVKVDMTDFGMPGETRTLNTAVGEAERKFVYGRLTYLYLHAHRDIAGGSGGRFKRKLVVPMLRYRNRFLINEQQLDSKAILEVAKKDEAEDLVLNLKQKGPGYFIDHINIYKGMHSSSYIIARRESAETVKRAAETGVLNRGDVEDIITTPFRAHDGSMQTIEKYWKKDARIMLNGVQNYETAEYDAKESDRKANEKGTAAALVEQLDKEGDVSVKRWQEAINTWRTTTGGSMQNIPAILLNYNYAGKEDDTALDNRLTWQFAEDPSKVTERDLKAFSNPILKQKWREKIARSGGSNDTRKEFLTSTLDEHFNNKLGQPGRNTLDYFYTKQAAQNIYDKEYDRAYSKSGNHAEAERLAQQKVLAELQLDKEGKVDYGAPKFVKENTTMQTDIGNALKVIAEDPTLVNSDKPWPGEEKYLIQAAKAYNNTKGVRTPEYYYRFSSVTKDNGKIFAEHRLKSVGWIKDGEAIIPEPLKLTAKEQEKIRFGSPSSTYQLTQEQADASWMLETVQDREAVANGGYDYVTKDGVLTKLEKPLSEHTIDEIIGLLNTGYDNFGIYGISADGLREVILNNPVDLDDKFDKETQDLLVLARLRQKAQQSQQYMTVDAQYRRLVNIKKEDRDAFLRIVGDLPPYLQLDNLLPAVATEMVQQTLQ